MTAEKPLIGGDSRVRGKKGGRIDNDSENPSGLPLRFGRTSGSSYSCSQSITIFASVRPLDLRGGGSCRRSSRVAISHMRGMNGSAVRRATSRVRRAPQTVGCFESSTAMFGIVLNQGSVWMELRAAKRRATHDTSASTASSAKIVCGGQHMLSSSVEENVGGT